jgi:hypothetical protein
MSRTVLASLLAAVVLSGGGLLSAQEQERPGRRERPERVERGERGERAERPERGERGERPERGERGERRQMTPEEREQRMAQWRQRMSDQQREGLGFSEEEWKAVKPLYDRVAELQGELRTGGMRGFQFGRRGGEQGERPEQSPLAKARQKLAEVSEAENASAAQLQGAIKEYRAAREKAQKDLGEAQKALREVLTAQQEAKLILRGMLD